MTQQLKDVLITKCCGVVHICVEKGPSHNKPGILKFIAVKISKTQIIEVNYLTENTFLLH